MQASRVVLVGLDSRAPAPNLIRLPAWKLPYLGAPERWTTGLNWYRKRTFDHFEPGQVDCVLSLELHSASSVQANQLAKRLGVPHVVTVAEVLNPCPLAALPPWRQFRRFVSRSADAVVCSVEMGRQAAIAMGCDPAKCVVMAPGVDATRFTPRDGGRAGEPVLLFVGELRPDKGILDIIAAAHQARAQIPDLRLVIIGDGPLRNTVTAEAERVSFIDYAARCPGTSSWASTNKPQLHHRPEDALALGRAVRVRLGRGDGERPARRDHRFRCRARGHPELEPDLPPRDTERAGGRDRDHHGGGGRRPGPAQSSDRRGAVR